MKVKLVSHINADGDLLPSWFEYYANLGVRSFHLIVHGSQEENSILFELTNSYPVIIEHTYDGEFTSENKQRHITRLLSNLKGSWVLLVDSDEFVELPYTKLATTIRKLELMGANALYAPMIQRITPDGSIETPEVIANPFTFFPLCSINLYQKMGVKASTRKYPLFFCSDQTLIIEAGNHNPPNGANTSLSRFLGVTHHFKWRTPVLNRLINRINNSHTFRHESVSYLSYLEKHGYRLPTADSFYYSRREFFQRGFLVKAPFNFLGKIVLNEDQSNPRGKVCITNTDNEAYNLFVAEEEVRLKIPHNDKFILVDDDVLRKHFGSHYDIIPFIENDGEYWGRPEDDDTAINELTRLKRSGANYIVFIEPSFWWLDYYKGFAQYLRSNFRCILENNRLVVFGLTTEK